MKKLWLTILLTVSLLLVGCNPLNTPPNGGSQFPDGSSGNSESVGESESSGDFENSDDSEGSGDSDDSESGGGSETAEGGGIGYRYFDETSQTLKSIPLLMWKTDGAYPTEYQKNAEIKIDGLRNIRKNDDTVYAFTGWYYDAAYTNAVAGDTLKFSKNGDVTLYAKIVERAKLEGDVVTATVSYMWNDYGDVIDGIEQFPEAMTSGLNIPTEYVEGETVTLPRLNMWRKNSKIIYEFEGWYYDEDLKNKVSGGVIPASLTGNVTLYAKIVAYVN